MSEPATFAVRQAELKRAQETLVDQWRLSVESLTLRGRFVFRCPRLSLEHLQVGKSLTVNLDTGDVDNLGTQAANNFSRKLHYLLANLTTDSARLIARQSFDSNGFETWRLLHQKFALPGATRHVSLWTQLLDFKFNPATFESDFNTWETIRNRYEQQVGTPLPDGVLVATVLNKTTGALQQHLRLNARTLQTYQQTRDTIVEHFSSNSF